MKEDQTLSKLHLSIQEAFNFDNGHLYEFSYGKPYSDTNISGSKKVGKLGLDIKDKFWYLFYFGDDWVFEIEFIGYGEYDEKIKYTVIIKSVGESPEQYPDYDDEEENY